MVFEVGGVIKLDDQININGDVTVAGQTAPGGITVEGARLRVIDDNVIIRGLNVRPGDERGFDPENRDGISIGRSDRKVSDVIIDGNSVSWSIDEGISVWGRTDNITISNNIVSEALRDSLHPKGEHSMGMLIGDGASEVSIIGNLLAHNKFRNPTIKDDSHEIEFINNVIYNYGQSGFYITGDSSAHVINNVFIAGRDTSSREPIRFERGNEKVYLSGNVGDTTDAVSRITSKKLFNPATKDVIATKDVLKTVLKEVGANPDDRNAIDARIIASVQKGTGSIIDSPDDVGGYGRHKTEKALRDTDNDGIPDVYEEIIGSNAKSSDANKDADKDGYTNIEEYINGLLDGFGKTKPKPDDGDTNAGPATDPVDDDPEPVKPDPEPVEPKDPPKADKDTVVVEAEDLEVESGMEVRKIGAASDDKVLQADRSGEPQKASTIFEGKAGTYNLTVDYFDESDGESQLSVLVNNKEVASWTWDDDLGSHLANQKSLTSKVIEALNIQPGDEIALVGKTDGREPLRVDKLTFDSTGGTSGASGTPSTPISSSDVIRVQAEDMDLSGFQKSKLGIADGKAVIMREGNGEHRAEHDFAGASGTYDVLIDYFDEADGESELTLTVNDKVVDSWVWDDHTDSKIANPDNATTYVIQNVKIS
ncbi:MAG: right-handed parallel beta-helix repeat-containing protein, partial [Pseudomonadota bacterium]